MDRETSETIVEAFRAMHDGRSVDDIVLDDELNAAFLNTCRLAGAVGSDAEVNWALFNARKTGNLGGVVVPANRQNVNHGDYVHAADIAARHVIDKHCTTLDRILCDPELRRCFDEVALSIAPDVSTYALRKAAMKLRKCRQLKPELVNRIASSWRQDVRRFAADDKEAIDALPQNPGIYLFHDADGYLYIGEAINLRSRVAGHLDHSDRKALARYFWEQGLTGVQVEVHVFSKDSEGARTQSRRAYESELIRERQPRFNVRP